MHETVSNAFQGFWTQGLPSLEGFKILFQLKAELKENNFFLIFWEIFLHWDCENIIKQILYTY